MTTDDSNKSVHKRSPNYGSAKYRLLLSHAMQCKDVLEPVLKSVWSLTKYEALSAIKKF